jgi:hypothetical protein
MDNDSIMSIASLVVSLGGGIILAINHKRVRSNCCGTKLETSLDIENTTPPEAPPLRITVPKRQEDVTT